VSFNPRSLIVRQLPTGDLNPAQLAHCPIQTTIVNKGLVGGRRPLPSRWLSAESRKNISLIFQIELREPAGT
jgi:hypothetical protein